MLLDRLSSRVRLQWNIKRKPVSLHCLASWKHDFQETAFPDNQRDCGCLDCMGTHAAAYPHMTWPDLVVEVNAKPPFRTKFFAARDVHTGQSEFAGTGAQSSVKSMKEQGVLTYRDMGLLTEAEFRDVLRVAPSVAAVKAVTWVNEEGQSMSGYLVSLMGCPCEIVHGIRKARIYSRLQISFANLLVQPGKQLSHEQGQNFYIAACEKELSKRPKHMQLGSIWRLKRCGDIIDLAEELEAEAETPAPAADEGATQDADAIVEATAAGIPKVTAPKVSFGFLDDSSPQPALKAKKRVKRDRSASPGQSSTRTGKVSVGQASDTADNENVKFLLENDPGMVKVYRLYAKIKGTEPECLLKLDAQTYLDRGGDGRSVDGAGTPDSLTVPCPSELA